METWRGRLWLIQVQLVDLLQRLRRLSDGILCRSIRRSKEVPASCDTAGAADMRWAECAQLPKGEYIGIHLQRAANREKTVSKRLQISRIMDRSEW
jgi:hypothetical protein